MRIRLKEKPKMEMFWDNTFRLILDAEAKQEQILDVFNEKWKSSDSLEYEVTIEPYKEKKKRSLDSNAYAWVLIGKLAEKLRTSTIAIYREIIRDMDTYTIVPIKTDYIEKWGQIWSSKGIGWITEDIGECRNTKGYHNIKCHYGTSVFNTFEMTRFIDLLIVECKEQGIETMTPNEIAEMLALEERGKDGSNKSS